MVHLTLVGLSEDRTRLLLVDDAGTGFTLDVDSRLRAALRGEHARLGQLEIEMDSSLRPRDIQARIRAGETTEAVASAAKTTVDKIMVFAGPVLAERAHLAERALRASIRRRRSGDAPARASLGEAVTAHLHRLNLAADGVDWDAFRREDGRWTLTGAYASSHRHGTAHFAYDAPGNFVVAENDDAHWLVGDVVETSARSESGETPESGQRPAAKKPRSSRRLSAVPSEELPLGDDALEMIRDEESGNDVPPDTSPGAASDPSPGEPEDLASHPDPASAVEVTPAAESALPSEAAESAESESGSASGSEDDEEPVAAPARTPRKKGRASVPSWDEIMFGGGSGKSD